MESRRTVLKEKLRESLAAVLPVTAIVAVLAFLVIPVSSGTFLSFLIGATFLVFGMGFFTLGTELSMTPMGEYVGAHITKSRKIWLIVFASFLVGVMITISEPDLQVLAVNTPSINALVLILSVAFGVGVFLVIAMLRTVFGIRLAYLLWFFYAGVFALSYFVKPDFWSVAFDSGGVTTGPMTVPFILALGIGAASIRSDSKAEEDSFGLVALCSIGPIMAVLVLGLVYSASGNAAQVSVVTDIETSTELGKLYFNGLPKYMLEVAAGLLPIVCFFFIFQLLMGKIDRRPLGRILIGLVYTYIGLVLFLSGANIGFMPMGSFLGGHIASAPFKWIIIPIGMLIGYFVVKAEPAVLVLKHQVEEVTSGAIRGQSIIHTLSIGIAFAVGLAMLRVLTGISIMYLIIPGYVISLVLTFFVPEIFTSIAFDSGGVASGPMTATFLLAFAIGACEAVGGNVITDAFGVVAMVAMTPLIAIQVLGLIYRLRLINERKAARKELWASASLGEDIIEL